MELSNWFKGFEKGIAKLTVEQRELFFSECKHSIFRLDTHRDLTYLCAVTFKNNDYGKRKSKLPGGI